MKILAFLNYDLNTQQLNLNLYTHILKNKETHILIIYSKL